MVQCSGREGLGSVWGHTLPWKIAGSAPPVTGNTGFHEHNRKDLTAGDVRFTSKIGALYAFRDALAGARSRHPDAGSRRQIGGRQNPQPETTGTTAANSNSRRTSSPCA